VRGREFASSAVVVLLAVVFGSPLVHTQNGAVAGRRILEPGQPPKVIHPTVDEMARYRQVHPHAATGSTDASGTPSQLAYHGGPVETSAKVYLVLWGSQWINGDPSGEAAILEAFYNGVGASAWSNTITQYCQGVPSGTVYCNGAGTPVANPTGMFAGYWYDNTSAAPSTPDQSQFAAEAARAAAHFGNTTSVSNATVQYVIATAHANNAAGFPTQYCAWHSSTSSAFGMLAYTNLPYITDGGASCGANFNGLGSEAGVTIVAGHELAETMTNPFPSTGWFDSSGAEIADKCAWISSGQGAAAAITLPTGTFAVQSLWSNAFRGYSGGCVLSEPASSMTLSPFSGMPVPIPGQILAVDVDNGGEGVAYHDTTTGNLGGQYRSTDVDIEHASDGGLDVGWIGPGEWLNYTVNVARAGTYTVTLRVGSPSGASLHVGFNGPSAGTWRSVSVPATGGWQNWTTVSVSVTLGAGVQQMTLWFDTGGLNVESANVTAASASNGGGSGSGTLSAFFDTPMSVPGQILAVDFDNGGEGVAYHDTTTGNLGGQYRSTDVDIEHASDGGLNLGWIDPGEWLNYTVNVGKTGTYTVTLRVASPSGASLHVGFNGPSAGTWQSVSVPATGGWQNWTAVSVSVTLGAGVQQMTLWFDTGGLNVESANVTASASN
jgi:hypothetical protein